MRAMRIGGGILVLGTGVLVASISVRPTGADNIHQRSVVAEHAPVLVEA